MWVYLDQLILDIGNAGDAVACQPANHVDATLPCSPLAALMLTAWPTCRTESRSNEDNEKNLIFHRDGWWRKDDGIWTLYVFYLLFFLRGTAMSFKRKRSLTSSRRFHLQLVRLCSYGGHQSTSDSSVECRGSKSATDVLLERTEASRNVALAHTAVHTYLTRPNMLCTIPVEVQLSVKEMFFSFIWLAQVTYSTIWSSTGFIVCGVGCMMR